MDSTYIDGILPASNSGCHDRGAGVMYQYHAAMVAIHSVYYNFARIHTTLRITPAMAAGLSETTWTLEDIITMADSYAPASKPRGPYKKRASA